MAEQPKKDAPQEPAKGPAKPAKKSWSNPALRAMGISKISLPSRNWMIFWTVLASVGGGIWYDRHQQKQIRAKYMKEVERFGEELYANDRLPRRLSIFIAPPPDDFLDESMKHFRRYIKPVLNSAAIDFTVYTENRQGDIRSQVAESIRDLRRSRIEEKAKEEQKRREEAYAHSWKKWIKEDVPGAFGKLLPKKSKPEDEGPLVNRQDLYSPKDVLGLYRIMGTFEPVRDDEKDIRLAGGVLCIGRGSYKEYMTGVHEGLLGPLEAPPVEEEPVKATEVTSSEQSEGVAASTGNDEKKTEDEGEKKEVEISDFGENEGEKDLKPVPKPFISPKDYANAQLAPELDFAGVIRNDKNVPVLFEQPISVFPLHKLRGFTNFPRKIYRFFTRRALAEEVTHKATDVVYADSRPFQYKDIFLGKEEELNWPKKWVERGKKKNSEWVQELEVDERVTSKMRVYERREE